MVQKRPPKQAGSSHRWDSMLAQGAAEPELAPAADRHSSTIIVKKRLVLRALGEG